MARPYHHGNLLPALITAAAARARLEGPQAVTVRDVARDVGVSPSAAYRHVRDRDHLMALVAQSARQDLARAMLASLSAVRASGDPRTDAVRRFAATGRGYVEFATASTPLFRTAFESTGTPPDRPDEPDAAAVLFGCLDDLVSVGLLDRRRRAGAPVIAWSAVHGLGSLLADRALAEPLGMSPADAVDAVLDAILRALLGPDVDELLAGAGASASSDAGRRAARPGRR